MVYCVCGRTYKTQRGLDNHIKTCKKVDAPPAVVIAVPIDPRDRKIAELTTLFVKFENMLYGEGTVAEKAREDIISLMIIRLLEPQFIDIIDIMDIEKYCYSQSITTDNIKFVCMRELAKLKQSDIAGELVKIWRLVLSVHPVTKQLFKSDRYLSIRSDVLLSAMVCDLAAFDFESYPMDCLAEVYQHFIHKQFKGEKSSRLGQHFTPTNVIKHMLDEVEDYLIPDGTFCDPFCGTGGFLLAGYDKLKNVAALPCDYLHGSEIDIDVYRYAVANLLIRTGSICSNVKNASAFDPAAKYSMIFSNPPFGGNVSKGSINSDFATVKTNSRNLLCLQLCMSRLAPGGICSIVFPFGSEMISTRNAEYEVRKKLITEHEIISVTYLPKGTFEYTGIGTVILAFRNTQGEDAPTGDIEFYELKDGQRVHLKTVTREVIAAKKYSLGIADYRDKIMINVDNKFEIKKLSDLIEFEKSPHHLAGDALDAGEYKFYTSSHNYKYATAYDFEGPNILLGKGGMASVHLATKFSTSNDVCVIKVIGCEVKYLYYYLCNNLQMLNDLFTGAGLQHISIESIKNIDVPVPSMQYQAEIIHTIDRMNLTLGNFTDAIEGVKFELDIMTRRAFTFDNVHFELKKLGELVDFKPKSSRAASEGVAAGMYPFIKSSQTIDSFIDVADHDGPSIIVGTGGNPSVHYCEKFSSSTDTLVMTCKCDPKYLYYYILSNIDAIGDMFAGATIKHLSKQRFTDMDVRIPDQPTQIKITNMSRMLFNKLEKIKYLYIEQKRSIETTYKQMVPL